MLFRSGESGVKIKGPVEEAKVKTVPEGGGSKTTGYFVGPNGKALPSQYKEWIGTNIQIELL